jgi:hypothetical protein
MKEGNDLHFSGTSATSFGNYRRFGAAGQSHLQGYCFNVEGGGDLLTRDAGKQLPVDAA